jgi:hypothetical protein
MATTAYASYARGVYPRKEHVGVEVENAAATWSPSPAPRAERTIWHHHEELRLVGCGEPRVEVGGMLARSWWRGGRALGGVTGELLAPRRASSGVDAGELLAERRESSWRGRWRDQARRTAVSTGGGRELPEVEVEVDCADAEERT